MKRRLKCLICVGCVLLLSGCSGFLPYSREISDLKLISVLGLDKNEQNKNGFTLTASVKREEPVGAQDGGDKPVILTQSGETLKHAASDMQGLTDKYISFGHIGYYIIGESASTDELLPYLDFLARDSSTRFSTKLYVVKGSSANELLNEGSSNNAFLGDRLKSLEKDYGSTSVVTPRPLSEVICRLQNNGCALVPALTLVES